MTKSPLPSAELLRKLLRYDPETGKLFWRERPDVGSFKTKRAFKIWNARFSGKQAFTANHNSGYKQGTILGRVFLAHRVVWCMVHGEWPVDQVDHINRGRCDNRIVNLRAVDNQENMRNSKMPKTNTSGMVGVGWDKARSKWAAQIMVDKKKVNLGLFSNKDDAILARVAANCKYGFHSGHGVTLPPDLRG